MPRRRKRVTETIELDALGLMNGTRNEAYIVEIKSHLQVNQTVNGHDTAKFRTIFPGMRQ